MSAIEVIGTSSSSSSSSSKRLKFQQEEYIVKERHDSTN